MVKEFIEKEARNQTIRDMDEYIKKEVEESNKKMENLKDEAERELRMIRP